MNTKKMIAMAICSLMLSINACKPEQGDPGQTGPNGDAGRAGVAGQSGPAGPKGVTGDKGPVGDKGATGAVGNASITTKSQTLGEWKLVREVKIQDNINYYFESSTNDPFLTESVVKNSIVKYFIKATFSGEIVQIPITQTGNSYFNSSGISGLCKIANLEIDKVTFQMNIGEKVLKADEIKKRLDNEKYTCQGSIITFK